MRRKDETGNRYGRWTILKLSSKSNPKVGIYYTCRCTCGTERDIRIDGLRNGQSVSCGCYKSEASSKRASITLIGNKSHSGRKVSNEEREKIANSERGDKHYRWKGGVKSLNAIIRETFQYRLWRSDVFTRDGFTCVKCGKKGYVHAHHTKSFSSILKEYKIKTIEEATQCSELWNINNGITLCKNCHNKISHRRT